MYRKQTVSHYFISLSGSLPILYRHYSLITSIILIIVCLFIYYFRRDSPVKVIQLHLFHILILLLLQRDQKSGQVGYETSA